MADCLHISCRMQDDCMFAPGGLFGATRSVESPEDRPVPRIRLDRLTPDEHIRNVTAELNRTQAERDDALNIITEAWAALNRAGVQSPTDSVAALINRLAAERDQALDRLDLDAWDRITRERDQARADLARADARHADADREITRLNEVAAGLRADLAAAQELIADLADPDPCEYDHHGYCQAHGWMKTEPRCPHARAWKLRHPALPHRIDAGGRTGTGEGERTQEAACPVHVVPLPGCPHRNPAEQAEG